MSRVPPLLRSGGRIGGRTSSLQQRELRPEIGSWLRSAPQPREPLVLLPQEAVTGLRCVSRTVGSGCSCRDLLSPPRVLSPGHKMIDLQRAAAGRSAAVVDSAEPRPVGSGRSDDRSPPWGKTDRLEDVDGHAGQVEGARRCRLAD